MKLIDSLVKELPKSGGWPKDAVTAIYFSHKQGTTFYDKDGMWLKNGLSFICMDIPGVRREEVTKEEFESALAASEGWIEWGGGECPVKIGALVDIRDGDGYEWYGVKAAPKDEYSDAAGTFWEHKGSPGNNIIAYRLHRDINSRASDDRLEQDLNECIGQNVDPAWSGDGLPPVGTICQARVGGEWTYVKVAYIGDEGSWNEALVFDVKSTSPAWADEFRPLRTKAEKALDSAKNIIAELCRDSASNGHSADLIVEAIAAGKIPGIKLEVK